MAMKRGGLLNSDLLRIIARAGHGDRIVVTDRGFPLSSGPWTEAIDLSVTPGLPRLMDVLAPLVAELAIEGFVLADETEVHNPGVATAIRALLESRLETRIPHTDFKAQVLGGGIAGQGASVPTGFRLRSERADHRPGTHRRVDSLRQRHACVRRFVLSLPTASIN
jgi:D-ribose pyranase